MSPARTGFIAALMALGLVLAATPAVADESTSGPTPIGCLNLMLSRIGDGLAIYAALNNVVGIGLSTDQPGEGAEIAVMVVPSACGLGGIPPMEMSSLTRTAQSSPVLIPLP